MSTKKNKKNSMPALPNIYHLNEGHENEQRNKNNDTFKSSSFIKTETIESMPELGVFKDEQAHNIEKQKEAEKQRKAKEAKEKKLQEIVNKKRSQPAQKVDVSADDSLKDL